MKHFIIVSKFFDMSIVCTAFTITLVSLKLGYVNINLIAQLSRVRQDVPKLFNIRQQCSWELVSSNMCHLTLSGVLKRQITLLLAYKAFLSLSFIFFSSLLLLISNLAIDEKRLHTWRFFILSSFLVTCGDWSQLNAKVTVLAFLWHASLHDVPLRTAFTSFPQEKGSLLYSFGCKACKSGSLLTSSSTHFIPDLSLFSLIFAAKKTDYRLLGNYRVRSIA